MSVPAARGTIRIGGGLRLAAEVEMELPVEPGQVAVGQPHQKPAVVMQKRQALQRLLHLRHPGLEHFKAFSQPGDGDPFPGHLAQHLGHGDCRNSKNQTPCSEYAGLINPAFTQATIRSRDRPRVSVRLVLWNWWILEVSSRPSPPGRHLRSDHGSRPS